MIWTSLGIAAVAALAAGMQSVSGFGFALLAVPLMSFMIGSRSAVVLSVVLAPLLNLSIAGLHRGSILRGTLVAVTVPAVVAMPLGLWVSASVGPRALDIAIGAVVIGLTALLATRFTPMERRGVDVAAGFASGVLATSTGTNGPPLVMALQAKRVSPDELRGTLAAAFLLQGVVAVAGFAVTGRLDAALGRLFLWALPGLVTGTIVGSALRRRIDPARFRILVLGLLLATAASLLLRAVVG